MSRLKAIHANLHLFYECNIFGLHLKPSTIAQQQAEIGSFANQEFTERAVTGYYYSTLLYHFMENALSGHNVDGEDMKAVTREQLQTFAIRPNEEISSSD